MSAREKADIGRFCEMNAIGKPERETQNRVVALFRDQLGYRYLGDWSGRAENSIIEEELLGAFLKRTGYSSEQISRAIYKLKSETQNANRGLYDNNRAVDGLLRYGVPTQIRDLIRHASGESPDIKAYEADMRHLIDTYIEADTPRQISSFGDMGLLEFLASRGLDTLIAEVPEGIRGNKGAVAETIANNVRSKIIREHLNDPAFYDRMSDLLEEIITALREKRLDYEAFLKKIAEIAAAVQAGKSGDTPREIDTPGKRSLYNNLGQNLELALSIDATVKEIHPADWRGNPRRENVIKKALLPLLGNDTSEVERVFRIIVNSIS